MAACPSRYKIPSIPPAGKLTTGPSPNRRAKLQKHSTNSCDEAKVKNARRILVELDVISRFAVCRLMDALHRALHTVWCARIGGRVDPFDARADRERFHRERIIQCRITGGTP